MPVDAREVHRGEGVCADGIVVHIHPQAFEVERGTVSGHVTLDPHRRRVAYPVMLGAEWTADIHPVIAYREDVRRWAAIALRLGEGGQAQQHCKNEQSVHVDSPRG